jgi:hypothetical protein
MALISTRTHAVGDYAGGALMIVAAKLPFVRDRRAAALLRVAGAGTLVASALTDYELGVWRKLPMRTHLAGDGLAAALMTASAALLRRSGAGAGSWLPHAAIGLGQLAGAALTDRAPSGADTGGIPATPAHLSGEGLAAREPAAGGAPIAPPPVETPGPSLTAPGQPESDIERAERVDAALVDEDGVPTADDLVAQQEAAAAAEAAAIGGAVPSETGDPSMDPVYEAGGGEQEGFETAEADLIENASHGEGHGDPARDALAPELESDASTAVFGESHRELSSEVVEDPSEPGDDPAQGPGVGADREPGPAPKQD